MDQLKVKFYCDGADKTSLITLAENPRVQGLTTNPTLMKKAGITNYTTFCKDVLSSITTKPVSLEVFADEPAEILRQARLISSWGDNVYVKIPITNSHGELLTPLIRDLTRDGVKINITAILTTEQIEAACAALVGGAPSIVSIFCGRIADTGRDPKHFVVAAKEFVRKMGCPAEVLWASTRECFNIFQADEAGADIITVPPDLLAKTHLFGYDLGKLSLDTVKMFKKDAETAGFSL